MTTYAAKRRLSTSFLLLTMVFVFSLMTQIGLTAGDNLWTSVGSDLYRDSNVGIFTGSTAPAYPLEVNGIIASRQKFRAASTQPGIILHETDSSNANRWIDVESGVFRILKANDAYTAFNTQMVIDASGNVGIGVSPTGIAAIITTVKLDVDGIIKNRDKSWSVSSQPGFVLEENDFADANRWIDVESGVFRIAKANDAYTAFDTQMVIDASGKVGIGTINPSVALDVNGSITASGTISGGTINAKYQDIAEWVPASQRLEPGSVVILDPAHTGSVTVTNVAYDTRAAGVVSPQPGLILGEAGADKVQIATTGRVKVRVDASVAPIHIGDVLVTSEKPGVAMKSAPVNLGGISIHRPGTIIGKAIEPLEEGQGEILVLLSLQ